MQQSITENRVSALVLGEDTRSFLSVVRSLGRAGYEVHVVCYDQTSPALASKYVTTAKYYNYQALTAEDWLSSVLALIERYQFDLIIPCDERAIYPLWSAKSRLPAHTQLAIANQEALDCLFDKWKTKQVAINCDVSVAQGHTECLEQASFTHLHQLYGLPFVIKPLQSFEETKLSQRQKVAIIHNESEFNDYCLGVDNQREFLIEAFFSGRGEGLSVFAIEGDVYAAFAHIRVAEPSSGGGSSYRQSIPLDEELLAATQRICRATNLTGVAMFEFRRGEKEQWILVEVNARFWGSLPLAIYAHVDFPRLYADYLVTRQKPEKKYNHYRPVLARALTADIYEMKREYEQLNATSSSWSARKHLIKRLFQLVNSLTPRETIDTFMLNDLGPFYAEMLGLFNAFFLSKLAKLPWFIQLRRWRTNRVLTRLFKHNPKRRILFVCYGNIMRSPFAAVCFQESATQQDIPLAWDSFGFHLIEQRACPDSAFQAALELGEDLSHHQSKWLSQYDLNETDIVIYFDQQNRGKLKAYYQVNHAFCAADLLDDQFPNASTIDDPYGRGMEGVVECYTEISNSVSGLLKVYKGAVHS
ncbi:ATP-grasp domain-containing protein [Vibrio tritonius]|uniref:protein-tyrosine-phosphatase n=1 Tax=Vibrio tritonius TaxID=1435069 RepID=A0ABS7YUV4_9VIBR|nr:ATP-grasp domain-containing protein [Vibrio tritonius]MCA2018009.1 ATP-grasp domain-containing protein [Vibrio tritonius]